MINPNCLKKEICKSLMFMWWASMFRLGFNFKMVSFATKDLDIPLWQALNKNWRFRLEIYLRA